MAKTNTALTHVKNKILLVTYIFRSLPIEDIQRTTNNPKERQRIRNYLVFLKRDGFIIQKQSLRGDRFIYLTKKGYTYVTAKILTIGEAAPLYQYKESKLLRKSVSEHSFMNFIYIWHYISEHVQDFTSKMQVYEESDMNKCKVQVNFLRTSFVVSPDVLMYTPVKNSDFEFKALFVENDNSRETYHTIYEKIIEYLVLASNRLQKNDLTEISLYFIFRSKQRIEQLFLSENGIVRFFKPYNDTKQIKDVRIKPLIQVLANPNLHLYISYFDDKNITHPYEFQHYDLLSLLLARKPEWKIYT
jgi:hypothetical protein